MRNRWILLGYLALFFGVVSLFDTYKDNDLAVILAATIILNTGLLAWVWSIQPNKEKYWQKKLKDPQATFHPLRKSTGRKWTTGLSS